MNLRTMNMKKESFDVEHEAKTVTDYQLSRNSKAGDKINIGDHVRTVGGWDALVVWRTRFKQRLNLLWIVHKPGSPDESAVVPHYLDGKMFLLRPVGDCSTHPCYGSHPADLVI